MPISPGFKNSDHLGSIPNLLLIAGTGRKVGKTTLACRLIGQCSEFQKITAVKISPHLHTQEPGQVIIEQNADFAIIRETNTHSGKDSSRMLQAGAENVYYVQCNDRNLRKPLSILFTLIPDDRPVICESGALLRYVKPGLFLLVKPPDGQSTKKGLEHLAYRPDDWLIFDGQRFNRELASFHFEKGCWRIVKENR